MELSSSTVTVVSVAVGGSLTGVTVIETVAVVVCWPSVTV
ncbi:putative membrane protein [Mycolicibacterium hassiacum DSM 44199]|uniref:Putative membrane protein n=1 Tax=Mycolicibacterium hassiacum (strain DSM 44199 / CIP 105218 / JCM 12690 / 3849) TaxID=1122247 RepID=K5BKE2_MYCHD|nr:putative membrane protein [Mycolicibacterium hassiacum DSM 44199]